MEGATRIDDLPDNISFQIGQEPSYSGGNSQNNGPAMGMSYAPMNHYPDPYGQGPPQQNAIPPPIYTKSESKTNGAAIAAASGLGDFSMPQYPLAQRDIPIDMATYVQDDAIKPNYIPPPTSQHKQYVEDQEDRIRRQPDGKKVMTAAKRVRLFSGEKWTWEDLFIELQEPIIVAILFLLFQIANINQFIQRYFAFLQPFQEDNITLNFSGLFFKSVLFGLAYFAFNQIKIM